MISLCPVSKNSVVFDEHSFETYYCPTCDCYFDVNRPMLNILAGDKKKMACIKKSSDGRIWFDHGLCSGAVGGAFVNRQGRVIAMHEVTQMGMATHIQVKIAYS